MNKEQLKGEYIMAEKTKRAIDIGSVIASQYSKDGDKKGFLRFNFNTKIALDGKVCQVNGFVTEVKGQ